MRYPGTWDWPDYSIMAPFVKVTFTNGTDYITVGNKSYPSRDNQAIIKSFEYGKSDGTGLTIEVFDEQGGAFDKFWNEMPKTLDEYNGKAAITAYFGWVGADCENIIPKWSSPKITATLTDIEVSVSQGKIKFIATASDAMQYVFNSRSSKSFGGDKTQKLSTKDAVKKLFKEGSPSCDVLFLRKSLNGGQPTEWDFQADLSPDGLPDRWSSDNQNKLAAATEWIQPFRTDKGRGIIPMSDPEEKSTIVFWEDWTPDCNEEDEGCKRSIGTFIVNGGKCSPVLEFSPKINWVLAYAKLGSGGGSSPGSHQMVRKFNQLPGCELKGENVGPMHTVVMTSQAINAFGPEKALKQTETSQAAHTKARAIVEAMEPVDAELRIIGNPGRQFCGTNETIGKTCSIIVINPFHLFSGGDKDCPEWLAQPGCNEHLSKKTWEILGFNHSITEGSYTTTLKLVLPNPYKVGAGGGRDFIKKKFGIDLAPLKEE